MPIDIEAELTRRNQSNVLVPWSLADETASPTGEAEPTIDVAVRGDWDYRAGVSGTVTIPAGGRVLGIACVGGSGGGSVTINGGAAIPIPANRAFAVEPRGNLVAPTIVLTDTVTYFIEFVT